MAKKTPQYPGPPQSASKTTPATTEFDQAKSDRRLKDVASARTIYSRFVTDNVLRSSTFAQTRNQLEGGRPYDPKDFQAQGTEWQTNVNFGDAQSARDRAFLPYWKMINSSPHKIAVTIDSGDPLTEKYQAAFAENFDKFLKKWGAGYFTEFMNFAKNFVDFGPGVVQWTDDRTPRFESVNVQRIYFPKNASMSPDKWEVIALQRDMTASELYGRIRNDKASKVSADAGWNVQAIKDCIVQMENGGVMPDYRDYTKVQDRLVNNDIAVTTPFQPTPIVWLYIKQYDGTIGAYAFSQNDGVDEFLFESENFADTFREILGAVWYDTGSDSMVHSIKGFGIKNYHFSALQNRMKSRLMDSGTMSMGINFQYENENTPSEAPPVENYGPFTFFPSGVKQLAIYPQIQAASSVIELLSNNQSQNNGLYRQQQQQIAQSDTATQANILATMAGELSEASAEIFLSQFGENIFAEQMRRLRIRGSQDQDAKDFQKRMKEDGIPDKVIYDIDMIVNTAANSSTANPAMRAQMFQQDLALMNIPGVNSRWFLTNLIANKYGAHAVDKALLPEGAQSNPLQRREALIENTMFGQGQPLPVDPSDAHFEHIQEHLGPLTAIVAQFKKGQQISPEQATALTLGTQHTGEHMGFLQQNEMMKAQFQSVLPTFTVVQNAAKGIIMQMQKSQQQGTPSPIQGQGPQDPSQQGGQVVPMSA